LVWKHEKKEKREGKEEKAGKGGIEIEEFEVITCKNCGCCYYVDVQYFAIFCPYCGYTGEKEDFNMSKWEIKLTRGTKGNLPTFCIGFYNFDRKTEERFFNAVAYAYSEENAAFILTAFERDSTTDDYNWWNESGYKRIQEVDPKRFPITELK
jgi:predicted nucleic-acid-binding Zn-ribbon protein